MGFSIDSKLGDIMKDEKASAVLEEFVPGFSKNPMVGLAKGFTLKKIASMPQAKEAGVTEEALEALNKKLKAL